MDFYEFIRNRSLHSILGFIALIIGLIWFVSGIGIFLLIAILTGIVAVFFFKRSSK